MGVYQQLQQDKITNMRSIAQFLLAFSFISLANCNPGFFSGAEKSTRQEVITLTLDFAMHWGQWGPQAFCPEGYFAHAFKLKVESEDVSDDTALNAIELSCIQASTLMRDMEYHQDRDFTITSLQGKWGFWRELRTCSTGFLTGLRMKSEPEQGIFVDDTAANDLEMACNWSSEIHNGGGDHWGEWSGWSYCPQEWAICGLETRVEDESASDDTALNDVK